MNSLINCSGWRFQASRHLQLLTKKNLTAIIAAIILSACGSLYEEKNFKVNSMEIADSVSKYNPGIVTDTVNGISRNFIRVAEMKFLVPGVLKSTQDIQDLVKRCGGFVVQSEMASTVNFQESVRFSSDSVKEIKRYTTVNYLTFRVPNKMLDSVMSRITSMSAFIDFRRLSSDDVKMKFYANQLTEKRNKHFVQKVENSVRQSSVEIKQLTEVQESALAKQSLADEKQIESYELADKVNYSTVKLQLYQPESNFVQALATRPEIVPYEATFTAKLCEAFESGFQMIKKFIFFLAGGWGLFVIAGVIYFAFKNLFQYFNSGSIEKEKWNK